MGVGDSGWRDDGGRRSGRQRAIVILLAMVCFASACSSDAASDQSAATGEPTPLVEATREPTPEPTVVPPTSVPTATVPPTPTPTVIPTATPVPTATAVPTSTPVPTPTVVDNTPVVIQGDAWTITEADVARLTAFIEETHQLEFTADIRIVVSNDIGFEFAPGYEAFNETEWYLLQALGLADRSVARESINQARRDRIRGVCCQFNDLTQVAVEVEATKLETETIVVHELTHALHTQHPELFERSLYETDETPRPFAASGEGVPQYIALEYFAQAPLEDRLAVGDELAIIRDDMVSLVGRGAADHLNFAYAVGPAFVASIVEARGVDGLFDLLAVPPATTEQILFPDKYLAAEAQQSVTPPARPEVGTVRAAGTLGAAMLIYVLRDAHGEEAAREIVRGWAGDDFIVYELDEQICLVANIAVDTAINDTAIDDTAIDDTATDAPRRFAEALVASLTPSFPGAQTDVVADVIELRTCGQIPEA